MRTQSISRKFGGIKYHILETFRENRATSFVLIFVAVIGIFTGIFTGIRYTQGASLIGFNDFSVCQYLEGELGTWGLLFSRIFSSSIVLIIIATTSFSIFLIPVNLMVICYRSYLLSLNCSLIIILNGLGGIISCLLIILPCQLITILLLSIFSSDAIKKAYTKRKYGNCATTKLGSKFLIYFLLLILLSGIETLLLWLFSSKVILVL